MSRQANTAASDFPWKVVDDDYPTSARTPGGEVLHFEDLLAEGQKIAHSGDGEGNTYPPYGIVVRRDDGLWIEAFEASGA